MAEEKESLPSWKQRLLVGILVFIFIVSTSLFLLLSLMVSPIGFTVGSFVTPTPTATPRPTATSTPTLMPGETRIPTPTLEEDPLAIGQNDTGVGDDPLVVWTTLIIAGFTSIISLISLVSTTTLNWRKESREARAANLEVIKMRLELEKTKLELEKLRKESKMRKKG